MNIAAELSFNFEKQYLFANKYDIINFTGYL